MDYCSSCRRYLDGALVCPGCVMQGVLLRVPHIAQHEEGAVLAPDDRTAAPTGPGCSASMTPAASSPLSAALKSQTGSPALSRTVTRPTIKSRLSSGASDGPTTQR
ncbi:hypothetical protein OK006_10787 [Actinobacteria bacterium OK006]|nr:hypothetical protein OK006_10787 [Actinobacteria bacterium OK006]